LPNKSNSRTDVLNFAYEDIFIRLIEELNENTLVKNDVLRLYSFRELVEKNLGETFSARLEDWSLRNYSVKKIQKAVRTFLNKRKFCKRKNDVSSFGYFFKIKAGIGKELLQLLFNNTEECMRVIGKNLTEDCAAKTLEKP
jgi:hypothetical protein